MKITKNQYNLGQHLKLITGHLFQFDIIILLTLRLTYAPYE